MIISPNRNATLWATVGLSASFQGVNTSSFLNPKTHSVDGDGELVEDRKPGVWSYSFQHHNANRSTGVFEDLSAGMAIRTKPISFMLNMGAVNWNEASPLSVWKAQPKTFAWDYMPYEMEEPVLEYYKNNIAIGEQVGRSAWNKKSFQGINLALTNAPGDLQFYFMYGAGEPYDVYERNSLDMGVDLGYAGDEGGIVETGTGDTYRKTAFYRVAKRFSPAFTLGFNNGFINTSSDIVNAGFKYDYIFNSKFDVGLFNSSWNVNGEDLTIHDKASYDKVMTLDTGSVATTVGQGYWLNPVFFSMDARGNINGKFSYMADVGFSTVETTYVSISNNSYATPLSIVQDTTGKHFSDLRLDADGEMNPVAPGSIHETWSTLSIRDVDHVL
jgi:hypothetical protein